MRDNTTPTYAKTNKEHSSLYNRSGKSYEQGQLGLWKLLFLGLFALALSTVPLLCLFVATPLVMASILYGRTKSYLMSTILVVGTLALSKLPGMSPEVSSILSIQFSMLLFGSLVALVVSEIILRRVSPTVGVFKVGATLALVAFFTLGGYVSTTGMEQVRNEVESVVTTRVNELKAEPEYKEFLKTGGEQALDLESALSQTKEISDGLITWMPAAAAVGFFIATWVAMLLVLRNSIVWRVRYDYPFYSSDLLKFRVPDQLVWILILGMGMVLAGSSLENFTASAFGWNILYALGVFYFFQGLGIYLDFLTHLRIFGLMRSLLVIFTVFMASKVIAFIGVFEIWANFRRFFNNQNDNEGDIK